MRLSKYWQNPDSTTCRWTKWQGARRVIVTMTLGYLIKHRVQWLFWMAPLWKEEGRVPWLLPSSCLLFSWWFLEPGKYRLQGQPPPAQGYIIVLRRTKANMTRIGNQGMQFKLVPEVGARFVLNSIYLINLVLSLFSFCETAIGKHAAMSLDLPWGVNQWQIPLDPILHPAEQTKPHRKWSIFHCLYLAKNMLPLYHVLQW